MNVSRVIVLLLWFCVNSVNVIIVLGYSPDHETEALFKSLQRDKKKGLFGNAEARLSRSSFANSDADIIISKLYKIPIMIFAACNNGGGVTMIMSHGLEHFSTCKCVFYFVLY